MKIETHELPLQLEAAQYIPAAIDLLQQRGVLTLVGLLRFKNVNYGIGGRVIDQLKLMGIIEPAPIGTGSGWVLVGGAS